MLREFIVNVGWTHKIQITQYDIHIARLSKKKKTKAWLSALQTVGLGSVLLEISKNPLYQKCVLIGSIFVSVGIVFYENYFEAFDLEKKAYSNKKYAEKYWEMQEEAILLLGKLKYGIDLESIEKEFDKLLIKRQYANQDLPHSSLEAVERASEKIKNNRDNVYDEDYIYFIPKHLNKLEDN